MLSFTHIRNLRRSPMQVQVLLESREQEAPGLRDLAMRRARFALRRLIALAPRAQLRLSNVKASSRGGDKRCEVKLEVDGGGSVIATSTALDWRAAVDNALRCGVRRLMRLWRRV